MKIEWSKISLIFLFLVALIGTLLRSKAFIPIPLEYMNLVHAHSHVAFQGWVYTSMILLLTNIFLTKDQIKNSRYSLQFKLTVIVVLGILISFSLQGYALYSIIFSTLFQFLNYWFIYRFLKDVRANNSSSSSGYIVSLRFVKTGLWLGLLSTFMPYGIGALSAIGLSNTEVYESLVYTFMHLQYNGWFLFVVLGLFFKLLAENNILINGKYGIKFYWVFTITVIPSTSLLLLGMEFSNYITIPAYISALLLAASLLLFVKTLPRNLLSTLKPKSKRSQIYIIAFLMSFALKIVLQCLSVLPVIKPLAFNNKSIIIAYLHLSLIGSISFFLIAMIIEKSSLPANKLVKIGDFLFIGGFVITELLLVVDGLGLYYNQLILIFGSAAMVLGILLMIISRVKNKKQYGEI